MGFGKQLIPYIILLSYTPGPSFSHYGPHMTSGSRESHKDDASLVQSTSGAGDYAGPVAQKLEGGGGFL